LPGTEAGKATGEASRVVAKRDPALARLVEKLDQLPARDELRLRQARELENQQNEASAQMYGLCRDLVNSLNAMLENMVVELSPEAYAASQLAESGVLFQINASGRIVQITIFPREGSASSEHFRLPYILRGAVRWFNQEYLERQAIEEQLVYYCLDGASGRWRYLDARTRRLGVIDREFLAATIEQLL
jgi:hypothetical protein